MSRSYKKFPIIRQEKEDYNYLNRRIRRDKDAEISPGSAFKRHSPHTRTWAYPWFKEDAIEQYQNDSYFQEKFPTLEEFLIWYTVKYMKK